MDATSCLDKVIITNMADSYKMTGQKWVNRIVGYDNVPPDQLLANPSNFRLHPKRQQDALTGSLNELGWLQDIIVNRVTDHVLDGHLRVQLALRNGEATVPVKYIELSESEEKLALAVFDPITYMAETDTNLLDDLLNDVSTGEEALQELIAQMHAENEITALQDADGGANNERALGDNHAKIKPVLYADQIATFEQAIRSTGLRNRGEALIAICESYLTNEEERQLDSLLEGVATA